jgi:hypothetical protein
MLRQLMLLFRSQEGDGWAWWEDEYMTSKARYAAFRSGEIISHNVKNITYGSSVRVNPPLPIDGRTTG